MPRSPQRVQRIRVDYAIEVARSLHLVPRSNCVGRITWPTVSKATWVFVVRQTLNTKDRKMDKEEKATPNGDTAPPYSAPTPDWNSWDLVLGCKIWEASMLYVDVNPSVANRNAIKEHLPALYKEYQACHRALCSAYKQPLFPEMAHPSEGSRPGERFILLEKFVEYIRQQGWPDRHGFAKRMSARAKVVHLDDGQKVAINFAEPKAKGERYNMVRMGALAKLLERALTDEKFNRAACLNGSVLSATGVGRELEKIIAAAAKSKDKKIAQGYTAGTNGKYVSGAIEALEKLF